MIINDLWHPDNFLYRLWEATICAAFKSKLLQLVSVVGNENKECLHVTEAPKPEKTCKHRFFLCEPETPRVDPYSSMASVLGSNTTDPSTWDQQLNVLSKGKVQDCQRPGLDPTLRMTKA